MREGMVDIMQRAFDRIQVLTTGTGYSMLPLSRLLHIVVIDQPGHSIHLQRERSNHQFQFKYDISQPRLLR
jgi:hypothetical protein